MINTLSIGLGALLLGPASVQAIEFPDPIGGFKGRSETCAEKLFGSWSCTIEFPDGLPHVGEVARILGLYGNSGVQIGGKLKQNWAFSALKEPDDPHNSVKVGVPENFYRKHSNRNKMSLYPPWISLDITDAETNRDTFRGTCNEPSLIYQHYNSRHHTHDRQSDNLEEAQYQHHHPIVPYLGYCIDYFTSFCACKVKRKKNYFSSSSSLVESSSEFVCNMPDIENTSWHNLPYIKYQHQAWDGQIKGDEMTLSSVAIFAPPNDCFETYCRSYGAPAPKPVKQGQAASYGHQAQSTNICANNCLFPNYSWRATATCSRKTTSA